MYKAALYNVDMDDPDLSWRAVRARIFTETGLPYHEIDRMGYADIMDTLSYWSAKNKIEETQIKKAKRKGGS